MIINTRIKKQLLQFYSLLNQNEENFISFLEKTQPAWLVEGIHPSDQNHTTELAEDLDLAKLTHLLSDIALYNKEHNKIIYNQEFLALLDDQETAKFTYSLLAINLYISKMLTKHRSTILDVLSQESIFSEYTNPSYLASAE